MKKILSTAALSFLLFGTASLTKIEEKIEVRDVLTNEFTNVATGNKIQVKKSNEVKNVSDEVKIQFKILDDGTYSVRFVAGLTSVDAEKVVFNVSVGSKTKAIDVTTAYTKISTTDGEKLASEIFEGCDYLIAYAINGIPESEITSTYTCSVELWEESSQTYTDVSNEREEVLFDLIKLEYTDDFVTYKKGYSVFPYVDYTNMNNEIDPYIVSNAVYKQDTGGDVDHGYSFVLFNEKSTSYYAEANITVNNSYGWTWNRVGIGSASDDSLNNARAFYYSINGDTMMANIPNTWDVNNQASKVEFSNDTRSLNGSKIKFGILRDGNEYYYLLNDKLAWYENNTKFDGIPTYPSIINYGELATITDWYCTTDSEELETKKALEEFGRVFFRESYSGTNINIINDNEFEFVYDGTSYDAYIQNYCVRAIGEKGILKGNFELEFDLENVRDITGFWGNDKNARIGVVLRQISTPTTGEVAGIQSDAFTMASVENGDPIFEYRPYTWEAYTADHIFWKGQDSSLRQTATGEAVNGHYKLVRTVTDNVNKVMTVTNSYVGDYDFVFGANIIMGTIKNPTWRTI